MFLYFVGLIFSAVSGYSNSTTLIASITYIAGVSLLMGALPLYASGGDILGKFGILDELAPYLAGLVLIMHCSVYLGIAAVTPWWLIALAPLPLQGSLLLGTSYASQSSRDLRIPALLLILLGLAVSITSVGAFD